MNYEELENVDDIDLSPLEPEYDDIEGEVTEHDIDTMIQEYRAMGIYA